MDDEMDAAGLQKTHQDPFFCECGKTYKYRQGLWKHQKKCQHITQFQELINKELEEEIFENNNLTDKDIILMLLKQNNEFKELIVEQKIVRI